MPMHQVDVDNEVFEFVKKHAEPLVDDFNSALRKLLHFESHRSKAGISQSSSRQGNGASVLPEVPRRTPQALRQILEVTHLVRNSGYARTDATHFVAKHHNVVPQTVLDKYTRQLDLKAAQFDDLLGQNNLAELRRQLKSKFPDHSDAVDQALQTGA